MSAIKRLIRDKFRKDVFDRDGHKCKKCSWQFDPDRSNPEDKLDAHHITDRNLMPNGGYVKENGISLCPLCHIEAERLHSEGVVYAGYEPDTLYKLIGSSYDLAVEMSKKLKK